MSPASLQSMVLRSEIHSALEKVNISNASAKALARDVEDLKQQLSRAHEQCKAGKDLRSGMMPCSELVTAMKLEKAAAVSTLTANQRQKEASARLKEQLAKQQEELEQLRTTLQVPSKHS